MEPLGLRMVHSHDPAQAPIAAISPEKGWTSLKNYSKRSSAICHLTASGTYETIRLFRNHEQIQGKGAFSG